MNKAITLILTAVFLISLNLIPSTAASFSPAGEGLLSESAFGFRNSGRQVRPLAIVRRFNPMVTVRHFETDQWINAERTHPLRDADTLKTDTDGFAVVQFMDNSIARVRPNSMLIVNGEVRAPGSISSRIAVEVGDMFLNISGVNSIYEVATPSAVASVRGTEFTTHVDESGLTQFTGFSGEVEVMALTSGQVVSVTRGIRATINANGEEITMTQVSDDQLNRQFSQYNDTGTNSDLNILRLRFINEAGEVEIIEIEYIDADSDDE